MMKDFFRDVGSDILSLFGSDAGAAAIAGAAGGVVRWLTLRETWREGIISLFVGAICAIYLSPLAEPMLRPFIGVIHAPRLAPFVVGVGGIGLVGLIIDAMRSYWSSGRDGG